MVGVAASIAHFDESTVREGHLDLPVRSGQDTGLEFSSRAVHSTTI